MPLGFGSDYGGSIRIPANFTGTVGFKTTQGRVSVLGFQSLNHSRWSPDPGTSGVAIASGPLAHSVIDCVEFFKLQTMENQHLIDPNKGSYPFN